MLVFMFQRYANSVMDRLFAKQHHRTRQPSIITGSSVDTMSTITTTVMSRKGGNQRRARATDDSLGETNSHHSQSSADDESNSLVSVKSGVSQCCKQGSLGLRRWQLFQMIVLPFIPITALIVQNTTLLSTVIVNLQETSEMKQQVCCDIFY